MLSVIVPMRTIRFISCCALLVFLLFRCALLAAEQDDFCIHPGEPEITFQNDRITLGNGALTAIWSTGEGKLRGVSFAGSSMATAVPLPDSAFTIVFADGRILRAASMRIADGPRIEALAPNPQAASLKEHFVGKRVAVRLEDPASALAVIWYAILRDGDNYVRQEISLSAGQDTPIREVRLFDFKLHSAEVVGKVKGSPVTAGNLFLGFEHPLSRCAVEQERVRCSIDRELPLKGGQSLKYSSGVPFQ